MAAEPGDQLRRTVLETWFYKIHVFLLDRIDEQGRVGKLAGSVGFVRPKRHAPSM